MFGIIKTVIETGQFELSDILKKIEKQWLEMRITDEQKNTLIQLARENARVQDSIGFVDLLNEIADLKKRVEVLETKLKEVPEEPQEPVEIYEEFITGKWYYAGNRIKFNGKNYECIAPENVVCVWNPNDYPAYWKLVE